MKSVTRTITVLSAAIAVAAPAASVAQGYRPNAPAYRPIAPTYRIANPIVIVPRQQAINAQSLQNAIRQQAAIQQLATQVRRQQAAQMVLNNAARQQAAQALVNTAVRQQVLTNVIRQQAANNVLANLVKSSSANKPLFSGSESPEQMISRLNSMTQADVNKLGGHWLDQFTPNWVKNAPGGNVLAQFGVGNGVMKTLATTDLNKILDPHGLDAIQGKLRQTQKLGQIAAGMAAEQKVRNDVAKYNNLRNAEKSAAEILKRLNEVAARTGESPN